MKIGIHKSDWGFSADWIAYCDSKEIPYKLVDCYATDIIRQLSDCNILLWHHHHTHAQDVLFAKQLLFSLQQSGMVVFPDFNAGWHFDDKVGQKYLLEAVRAPIPNSYVFYSKTDALLWIQQATFPKVFKLRGGAGSTNVMLVETAAQARKMVSKAFGKGFSSYNKWVDLKENIRRYRLGNAPFQPVLKSLRRFFMSTAFARTVGRYRGYVYFQDFIPNNGFDIRVVTVGNKAFGIKRLTRRNDFRASGSGLIIYDRKEIPERCVQIAFDVSARLNASVVAYDFVLDSNQGPLIVEINYGYAHKAYFNCPGFWDRTIQWHGGSFNSAHWIVEDAINRFCMQATEPVIP